MNDVVEAAEVTSIEEVPAEPNKHEVLSWQLTNMTLIQRRAVNDALLEHAHLVERCRMLEAENKALTRDVARLTLERIAPETNGHQMKKLVPARARRTQPRPKLSVRAK